MDAKDHVAFCVGDDGVGMGGYVIEQVARLLHGVLGGSGLG